MKIIDIIDTDNKQWTIYVSFVANHYAHTNLLLFDYDNPKTIYFHRTIITKPNEKIIRHFQFPISPKRLAIAVDTLYNIKNLKVDINAYEGINNCTPVLSKETNEFVRFALSFSKLASYLPINKTYYSENKTFKLKYVDKINNLTTPAMTTYPSKVFYVARYRILPQTVAMRYAILCHEYGHISNDIPKDDFIADKIGLDVFLSTGFTPFEYLKGFLDVFRFSNNHMNTQRYYEMKEYANKVVNKYNNNRYICSI